MNKPVVFFSHSGRDKDMLLPIKDKISVATCNTLNIFMSSDGQSIPFGKNWLSQVENGLQTAKLMFVFITPASLESGWIYFETGYAYAKGIKVVPVGINVSIGNLKPPINMLQGFDITSGESLNNLITIINREFSCNFQPCFDADDYLRINSNEIQNAALIQSTFSNVCSKFFGPDRTCAKQKFDQVKAQLSQQSFIFTSNEKMLLSGGLRAEIVETSWFDYNIKAFHFELSLSTHNFSESFDMLNLVTADFAPEQLWLECTVADTFHVIAKPEDLSSVICKHPSRFSYSPLTPQAFLYKGKIHVIVVQNMDEETKVLQKMIRFGYSPSDTKVEDIIETLSALFDIGVVSK